MKKETTTRPGGVIIPVLTPVAEGGVVDEVGFRSLIRRCIAAGADAIFVGGSAGMGPMLTDAQWQAAVSIAADETGSATQLFVGIITTSTQRAIDRIRVSQRIGCNTIVVTPTFYISLVRDEEILAHFAACRDATDQEMIVYNIPSCTHSTISAEVLRAVAQKKWTRTIKESSGDRQYFSKILEVGRELDINVLQGNEPDIAWGLKEGAAGIVPVCANCEPAPFVEIVRSARAGDWGRVDQLQELIDKVRDAIIVGDHNWIAGLTYAISVLGIGSGKPLLPLQPVGEARCKVINDLFADMASFESSVSAKR